ncbi:MAG: isopentenyl phosphate kinase family protein, partial [Methanobrevibacter sp.]|nr:isopentenyl phosphate kinase family protein [Methanobrevibacter sp.]
EEFEEKDYSTMRIGFAKTHNSVNKLSGIVSKIFIENEIPVVSIPPASCVKSHNKRINYFNLELINQYLKEGFIPILYGDVVLDDKYKMAVISGDQIITYLSKNLNFNKVILASDVDGVFNKNPKIHGDAELIKNLSSIDQLEHFDTTTNVDVTGGMVGKIKELLELSDLGIESKIINANKPGLIKDALEGKRVEGTLIRTARESLI